VKRQLLVVPSASLSLLLLNACTDRPKAEDRCWSTTVLRATIGGTTFDLPAENDPFPGTLDAPGLLNLLHLKVEHSQRTALSYCQDKRHVPIRLSDVKLSSNLPEGGKAGQFAVNEILIHSRADSPNPDDLFTSFEDTEPVIAELGKSESRRPLTFRYSAGVVECSNIRLGGDADRRIFCAGEGLVTETVSARVSFASTIDQAPTFPRRIERAVAYAKSHIVKDQKGAGAR